MDLPKWFFPGLPGSLWIIVSSFTSIKPHPMLWSSLTFAGHWIWLPNGFCCLKSLPSWPTWADLIGASNIFHFTSFYHLRNLRTALWSSILVQEAHNLLVEKVLKVNKVLGRALKIFRKLGVSILSWFFCHWRILSSSILFQTFDFGAGLGGL